MMDIDPHRVITHPLAAGVGGAVVGLRFAPGLRWYERITNVVAGAACAGWIAPAAGELFGLASVSAEAALSFAVGMFGMSVAAALIEALRTVAWAEIISGWIRRRGG